MYLKHFGFQEKPFHITPNPRFIFLSKNHKDAFAHLLYGLQQRVGFLSLTGEVGTGKTTVLRTLLGQLEEGEYSLALILNPCLSALELMETIHREFSIPYTQGHNLGQLHESLNHFLLQQRESGKTVVLVIDEAQNLEPSVLEQLRLLSNLETETDKLIQMILVGQPELELLFDRQDLRQLRQRLVVRYRLLPMDAEDTGAYIRHRLKIAGWQGGRLFSAKAVQSVYRLTGGTPRLINILCDRSLLVAYSHDQNEVDHRIVNLAQSELRQAESPESRTNRVQISLVLTFLCAIFLSLVLLWPKLSQELGRFSQASVTQGRVEKAAVAETVAPVARQQISIPREPLAVRVERLQQRIAALAPAASTDRSVDALLSIWGVDAPRAAGQPPEVSLQEHDLQTFRFKGDLDALLAFNTPVILEMMVPIKSGSYHFTLLGYRDDQILLEPYLTESGWVDRDEFEQVWFGRALVPWVNTDKIPYLVKPGIDRPGVIKLQTLLRKVGFVDLSLSGIFDHETIRAVTALQRENRLIPDGRVGPQTLLLIYRLAGYEIPELSKGESS